MGSTCMHGSLLNLLLVDLVAGDGLQARHVGPGQLPALLRQVLEGRILTRRGCAKQHFKALPKKQDIRNLDLTT